MSTIYSIKGFKCFHCVVTAYQFSFSNIENDPFKQITSKTFQLKHVFHHGVDTVADNLFIRLDIDENKNWVSTYIIDVIEASMLHFKEIFMSLLNKKTKSLPNPKDKKIILGLAKMSYDAYIDLDETDQWVILSGSWDKLPFGWKDNGIRGYVYADESNSTVIIGIKGTSINWINGDAPTAGNDKYIDNLMFSCCCAKVDFLWNGVCGCHIEGQQCNSTCISSEVYQKNTYYSNALRIYEETQKNYPNSTIWLTGGSLASLVALKYKVPAVTFQAPGDLLYAKRLGLDTTDSYKLPIYHFGHTGDPVFMGECNGLASTCYHFGYAMETKCHTGNTCSYDTISKFGWRSEIKNHSLLLFIKNSSQSPQPQHPEQSQHPEQPPLPE
ncbi:5635_t:CDS:2 [Entrophospora sp. SA101]|nr:5635_t:CDS:2 [Entrophospora sp. SA101]